MINIKINTQPNDETCGATSLHAIYRYYGYSISHEEVISGVKRSLSGGTLATLLGRHALEHGFNVTVYTNNLYIVDPSWFDVDGRGDGSIISSKLKEQLKYKSNKKLISVTDSCLEYFRLGGHMCFQTLNTALLNNYFKKNIPIMTGLSATYLYGCLREYYTDEGISVYDDVRGSPCGHFVILCGYDEGKKHAIIADPHKENPLAHNNYYYVDINRLINAIMLGVITSDGTLIIVEPK